VPDVYEKRPDGKFYKLKPKAEEPPPAPIPPKPKVKKGEYDPNDPHDSPWRTDHWVEDW
jgi:hypothetical protein